jgi:hypothetical protein
MFWRRVQKMSVIALYIVLFLACISSGGAVLAEAYGIASLHDVVWFAAVPSYIALLLVWLYARRSKHMAIRAISETLVIGTLGGFLGTAAYDVLGLPSVLTGMRVFIPNDTFGLWILDTSTSSRFTATAGWLFHFANGMMFGIMYALFMRRRHWAFAVAWAFLLETIALISPYGEIYHLAGNPMLVAEAYFEHLGYGLPLGFMVMRWDACIDYLNKLPCSVQFAFPASLAVEVVVFLTSPSARFADQRTQPRTFIIEDKRLLPDWLRLTVPEAITLRNTCSASNVIVIDAVTTLSLAPCEEREVEILKPGIHQLFVRTERLLSGSSFVLVEPVAAVRSTASENAASETDTEPSREQ